MWHNHQHLFEKDNYSNNLINEENDGHWILTIKDKGNSISEEICGENLMPLTCQMLREGFTDAVCARENVRDFKLKKLPQKFPFRKT